MPSPALPDPASDPLSNGADPIPGRLRALDRDWQFPAITEQQAFRRMTRPGAVPPGTTYLAFPWATLIDKLDSDAHDREAHIARFETFRDALPRDGAPVATVCQHIRLRAHIDLFRSCGVTDIWWSHATDADVAEARKGGAGPRLHPFPLYPVQVPEVWEEPAGHERRYLFSFVGARASRWYLTEARNWILDHLSGDPRGLVIGRDGWHYNSVVYDLQIRTTGQGGTGSVDEKASLVFRESLRQSLFSLCPSGSGPNSIRLWESLGAGSIPVILSDDWAPPGPAALWEAACVRCVETARAVRELPDRLTGIATDPVRLAAMRHAMRQLWMLYGPQAFTPDVEAGLTLLAGRASPLGPPAGSLVPSLPPAVPALLTRTGLRPRVCLWGRHGHRTPLAHPVLRDLVLNRLEMVEDPDEADLLVTGYNTDFAGAKTELRGRMARRPGLRLAVISEEPLWDSVWSGGIGLRHRALGLDDPIPYVALTHVTSAIFRFEHFPYYPLSDPGFVPRWRTLLEREESAAAVLARWRSASVGAAFYLEKRDKGAYDRSWPDIGMAGLSVYRSRIAELTRVPGKLVEGRGWAAGGPRQALPSWHLDKLARLDGRARVIGAIENTHHRDYISEKVFDALALGAVPVVHSGPSHRLPELVAREAVIDTAGLTPEAAAALISGFAPGPAEAEAHLAARADLSARLANADALFAERRRIASEVAREIEALFAA